MPYKKPKIPIFPQLLGVERRVQDLQIKIAELDWLECSFGLAKRVTIERGEEAEQAPVVYEGLKRDPLDVRMWPNDTYKAYTFWSLVEAAEFLYFDSVTAKLRYPKIQQQVALIVCLDNEKISHNQDYNITHSICKNEIISKLNSVNMSSGIFQITSLIENLPVEVFADYDVDDNLMEPQSCFRIEGLMTFTQDCDSVLTGSYTQYPTADMTTITADSTFYTVDNIEV